MTFTIGPGPAGKVRPRPRPGPQPAQLLLTSPGPARTCKFQARTRPGPQTIIETWPGPAHGLRAGPARGPRPGPCRTLIHTQLQLVSDGIPVIIVGLFFLLKWTLLCGGLLRIMWFFQVSNVLCQSRTNMEVQWPTTKSMLVRRNTNYSPWTMTVPHKMLSQCTEA